LWRSKGRGKGIGADHAPEKFKKKKPGLHFILEGGRKKAFFERRRTRYSYNFIEEGEGQPTPPRPLQEEETPPYRRENQGLFTLWERTKGGGFHKHFFFWKKKGGEGHTRMSRCESVEKLLQFLTRTKLFNRLPHFPGVGEVNPR